MSYRSLVLRLSAGLACLTVGVLFAAFAVGLLPNREEAVLQGRKALCESLAIHCSLAAQRNDPASIGAGLRAVAARNPEILSAGVRRADGELLTATADHERNWQPPSTSMSTPTQVQVPIALEDKLWGTVELRFEPITPPGLAAVFLSPAVRLVGFVGAAGFIVYGAYLFLLLKRLKPPSEEAAPRRVRDALNTLAEGVLILDKDQRIALANDAFARLASESPAKLRGRLITELPWNTPNDAQTLEDFPWARAIEGKETQVGGILALRRDSGERLTLSVNSTPILSDNGEARGALATFDDLTTVERKNARLRKLLRRLRHTRREVQRQNQRLRALATRDPLTGCLNRRSFFAHLESCWGAAHRYSHALSCIMLDIDHFKAINDKSGHAVGDQVLQQVAETLKGNVRQSDFICRYGGEEFCILLPHSDLEEAGQAAERFRQAISARSYSNLNITASLGVTTLALGAREPLDLLDEADRALYAAKRTGRNRVVRADAMPALDDHGPQPHLPSPPAEAELVPIPFHAVTALLSALAYRNVDTGEHSRRVADLCVALANGLMPQRSCYILEVAGLLHDIGKLGVPDSILLKPGPLTPEEWKVMRTHEQVGVEILSAAFTCAELTSFVRTHHAWFGGTPYDPELPKGQDIPLGARILSIADAYDAMISNRVYRPGRDREAAFGELRRCAGMQFDPELVERFIEIVQANDTSRDKSELQLSKQAALRIGVQIEKLACAIDAHDNQSLALMAGKLQATASESGIRQIADLAGQLQRSAESAKNWLDPLQLTINLLELCRSTYSSYLPRTSPWAAPKSATQAKMPVVGPVAP